MTPQSGPHSYPNGGTYPVQALPIPEPESSKSRKTLYIMLTVCAVLALGFGGSAYFFYFSGASPTETVEQYISRAQDEDFAGARDLTATGASQGVTFQGDSEGMDAMRRWFGKDSMEWKVREENTSGATTMVIVDKTLTLPNYGDPVAMRWDYELKRESGTWAIQQARIMPIVGDGLARPGECLQANGFEYTSADCASASGSDSTIIYSVTDEVTDPIDCPNPAGQAVETTEHDILCLEETQTG